MPCNTDCTAAVFGAQLLKRIMNLADQLGGVVHRGSGGNVLQVVYGFRPSCSLCHPGAAAVDGDAHDPGPQRPLRIPAPQTSEDAQKNLLGHIFGIVAMVQEPDTEPEHLGVEPIHQAADRLRVAVQTAAYQSGFFK